MRRTSGDSKKRAEDCEALISEDLEEDVNPTGQLCKEEPKLLHQFFEASASRYPDHVALEWYTKDKDKRNTIKNELTYHQLNEKATQLSHTISQYVHKEAIVVIILHRASERVHVAQIAAMKAGAAYLCIDLMFPDDRIRFILSDSAPVTIVTDRATQSRVQSCMGDHQIPVVVYEDWEISTDMTCCSHDNTMKIEDNQLAYVIYTSGSTGQPKGVLVEHRNVCNLIRSNYSHFPSLTSSERCTQQASMSFDQSVEEIYLAFAFGSTVIIVDDEVTRSGPDLGLWLMEKRVSVMCGVPTLLRMMGPKASKQLKTLKVLYVGGEELTKDIADVWSQGRRLENAYGPTECAITITRCTVQAGAEITIGKPVANNQAWVLDDELNRVGVGEWGELCISGPNVARGYLNREELTAEKFYQHPELGRIYRTGDLVEKTPEEDLIYHGRIDAQVKVHGYRIELPSIESYLAKEKNVAEAACVVQEYGTDKRLVAFLQTSSTINVEDIKRNLSKNLPKYMIPSEFRVVESLPRQVSAKIDRKMLAKMAVPSPTHTVLQLNMDEGQEKKSLFTTVEHFMLQVITRNLNLEKEPSLTDDFFQIGGTSLTAATVISEFRNNPLTESLAVRDVYEQRTVQALSKLCNAAPSVSEMVDLSCSKMDNQLMYPGLVTAMQFLMILITFYLSSAFTWFLLLYPLSYENFSGMIYLAIIPIFSVVAFWLWIPVSVLCAVIVKSTLIGHYKAGRYPIWSWFYFRHWLSQGSVALVPWKFIEGSIFQVWVLRLLGAKIGNRVHIHRGAEILSGGWDLLEIGDDVTLGRDVALFMVDYENQEMVVGKITIEDNVTMETRSGIGYNASVGNSAYISAHTIIESGTHVPKGSFWEGVPGTETKFAPSVPKITKQEHVWSPVSFSLLLMSQSYLSGLPFSPFIFLLIWDAIIGESKVMYFDYTIVFLIPVIAGSTVLSLLLMALYCRLLGQLKEGVYHNRGTTFLKATLKDIIVERCYMFLDATLFWPMWLRLAGMKIGQGCEMSNIKEVVPELVSIGDESFFAAVVYLGGPQMHGNTATLKQLSFGNNTFLGNHVIIPVGSKLPPDILIGVNTIANAEKIHKGATWFGNPIFQLPNHEQVEIDSSLTQNPSLIRYTFRVFWELHRFFLPLPPTVVFLILVETLLLWRKQFDPLVFYLGLAPSMTIFFAVGFLAIVFVTKWVLLGRMREGKHGLWSFWIRRWDTFNGMMRMWVAPMLAVFNGTLIFNWILRFLGVNIGKRVFLGPRVNIFEDPDLLFIEDYSTVLCKFQAHSFEDRVMKNAPLHIRRNATVGSEVTVMYGADIGEGCMVGKHSVVMKRESLLPNRFYTGCPTKVEKYHS